MGGVRGDVVEAEEEAGEEGGSTSRETITITESVDPTISIRRRENSAVLCHTLSASIYILMANAKYGRGSEHNLWPFSVAW